MRSIKSFLGVALLTQQLGYVNILPMYVVLMLLSPAILVLARLSASLALGASITVYLAARFCGWTHPSRLSSPSTAWTVGR